MNHQGAPTRGKPLRESEAVRVLVIDDSELAREMIRTVLTDAGMKVSCLESAVGGTAAIIRHDPHVLVVDLNMPMLSGGKFVDLIRRNPLLERIGMIMISGESEEDLRRAGTTVGADYVIPKAQLRASLVPAIRSLVAESGASSESESRAEHTAFVVVGDASAADNFRVQLTRLGFDVLVRTSGWGVARYLADHPPTILFISNDVGGSRAADLLAPLRESRGADQTKIVMCGRRDDDQLVAEASRLGIHTTMRFDAPAQVLEQKVHELVRPAIAPSGARRRPE